MFVILGGGTGDDGDGLSQQRKVDRDELREKARERMFKRWRREKKSGISMGEEWTARVDSEEWRRVCVDGG